MSLIRSMFAIIVALSLIFVGEVEAKHGSDKARSRVLKEISRTKN